MMTKLEKLQQKNPNLRLYSVEDLRFSLYGKIRDVVNAKELISAAEKIAMPKSNNCYNASQKEFEAIDGLCNDYANKIYGEMPVQIGFCWGYNDTMDALEWHKGNEINIAVTDFILLLGLKSEAKNGIYNSTRVEGFLVEKGTQVELFENTLHYCPCQVSENGFKSIVVLPKGTNLPLDNHVQDKLLLAKNKWIIAHEENDDLIKKGIFGGIFGENYKIKY